MSLTRSVPVRGKLAVVLSLCVALLGYGLGGSTWKRSPSAGGSIAVEEPELSVTLRGSDRPLLVSAADTIARELKSFPHDFESASHGFDAAALRAKGLFQLPLPELERLSDSWEEWAPLVVDPTFPVTSEAMLRRSGEFIAPGSPLTATPKRGLLSTASMLESLETYLEPAGVYLSSWSDPLLEQALQRIDQTLSGFPADEASRLVLHTPVPLSEGKTSAAGRSVRILRDVVRRVAMVFPSVSFEVGGTIARQWDEQRLVEQTWASAVLIGSLGTVLVAGMFWRSWRSGLALAATVITLSGWLVGWATLMVGRFDTSTAGALVLAMPLALVAPIRFGSLFIRARKMGIDPLFSDDVWQSILGSVLPGALLAGAAGFGLALTPYEPTRTLGWTTATGSLLSIVATFAVLAPLLHWWTPIVGLPAKELDHLLPGTRLPRFWATLGTSLVVLAGLGIGRWFGREASEEAPSLRLAMASTDAASGSARSEANSAEEARRLATAYRQRASVERVAELASWIPSDQAEKMPLVESLARVARAWKNPTADLKEIDLGAWRGALRDLTDPATMTSPNDQILVDRVRQLAVRVDSALSRLSSVDQQRRLLHFEKLWVDDLARQLDRMARIAKPDPVQASDLPAALAARLRPGSGRWVVLVYPKVDGTVRPSTFRDDVLSIDPRARGSAIDPATSLSARQGEFGSLVAAALGVSLVVGWLLTRHFGSTLVMHLPVVGGAWAILGILAWLGIDWSSATLGAWCQALPALVALGLWTGWEALRPLTLPGRSLFAPSLATLGWVLPLVVVPHPELARLGVTLVLTSTLCPLVAQLLVPGWRAILVDHPRTLSRPTPSSSPDLGSTVFYREAA
jgi:hypothetical protein